MVAYRTWHLYSLVEQPLSLKVRLFNIPLLIIRKPFFAGVFTPSDELANEVFSAAEASGEKLWRMPLEESYWESMKSGVADMVNTGGRQGGAITAALFLKQVTGLLIVVFLSSYTFFRALPPMLHV